MRFALLAGIAYSIWAAFEVFQILSGAEALTGPVVVRTVIQVGTAVCITGVGVAWRRDRERGAG